MRFLFPQVLTSCHIINYGSKHALNTQRKAQQHSLNICVYYAHFSCGMNVPFKNTIGGKPLQMKSIPPILLSISYIVYSSIAACAAVNAKFNVLIIK